MTTQEVNQKEKLIVLSSMIAERFEIVKRLGKGGFGSVFQVKDKHNSDVILALKIINEEQNRFEREVKINRMLGRVIAVFPTQHCFVIPWIEGITMDEYLSQSCQFSDKTEDKTILILDFLKDVLEKLQSIHSKEIVHRDLNPKNLIYSKDDKFVIIDFGMSCFKSTNLVLRALNEMENGHSTALTQGMYNSGYSAPENCQDPSKPSYASDLYSLGAIAIRWATGVSPEDLTGKKRPKLLQQAWDTRKHQAPVSSDLAEIISQMVAPDLDKRYQTCQEVLKKLAEIKIEEQTIQGSLKSWIGITDYARFFVDNPFPPAN